MVIGNDYEDPEFDMGTPLLNKPKWLNNENLKFNELS
jgi:hypothetical protein